MLAMEENAANHPHKIFEVKQAIEEGNSVAVHSHVKQNQEDLGGAVVHIFASIKTLSSNYGMWDSLFRSSLRMRTACFEHAGMMK